MTRLNITNGDVAGDALKHSAVEGDVLVWRDSMHDGPFPEGLDLDALSSVRAAHLTAPGVTAPGLDPEEVLRGFHLRNAHLSAAPRYEEIVLWFEHDLLDQLQLLQILDWFAARPELHDRLSLVCIDRFEGIEPFRGLGQLTPAQIATLLPGAAPVTPDQLALAARAWAAFRAPDPRAVEALLAGDASALPFLGPALARHLEEFPSTRGGLGRTDAQLLRLVGEGVEAPARLFGRAMALETVFFPGDWTLWTHLTRLCEAALLDAAPGPGFRWPEGGDPRDPAFRAQRLSLSPLGRDVLDGAADAARLAPLAQWLGGVKLAPEAPLWRRDAGTGAMVLTER